MRWPRQARRCGHRDVSPLSGSAGANKIGSKLGGKNMTLEAERIDQPTEDPVSNILKWVLLVVAVLSFAILGWTTRLTYEAAPPFPDRFVTPGGTVLMTAAD